MCSRCSCLFLFEGILVVDYPIAEFQFGLPHANGDSDEVTVAGETSVSVRFVFWVKVQTTRTAA